MSEWWWRLSALVAGGLPLFAFPAPALWWWAFLALVPALLVIRAAPTRWKGTVRGWWAAAGYGIGAIYWTVPNIGPALLLVAFGLGLLYALYGWLAWELLHGPATPWRAVAALALLPCSWVAAEYARSWSALGGPWAVLGASQWNDRAFLSLASLGGVWLISFALVAINTGVVIALVSRVRPVRLASLAVSGAVVLGGFLYGEVGYHPLGGHPVEHLRVAMVQPGPGLSPAPRFTTEIRETRALAGRHPQLVVWGETSVSFDLADDPGRLHTLEAVSRSVGADILVNQDTYVSALRGIYKTSALVGPRGIISSYEKMRLVPFGEYIPFRSVLGWLSSISRAASVNRHRGTHLQVMVLSPALPPVGPLICFEEAFPDMSRHLVAMGAQVLVYQTSDSTFEGSWELPQHAALAAVRASETDRPAVQVALTGDSVAFEPGGGEVAWLPRTFRGTKVIDLAIPESITPFVRWGDWVPDGALVVLLVAGVTGLVASRRRQRWTGIRPDQ